MSTLRRTTALLLAAAASAGDARADEPGGLRVGLQYASGLDHGRIDDFLYPSFGWTHDRDALHVDGQCMLPFAAVDAIFGLLGLIGGGEMGLPIWEGLNGGDDNPGWVDGLHANVRYAYWRGDQQKLDCPLVVQL